jgi:DNA-3-methyladenine glycosylase I
MSKKIKRCAWAGETSLAYIEYHDKEWGVPAWDDQTQFEFLILEGAQAGLSWSTILNKREGYRKNFADFDVNKVARFTPKRIEKILQDPGIVRNKLKVNSAVVNAKAFLKVQEEFDGFCNYIWRFVDGKPKQNNFKKDSDMRFQVRWQHHHVCAHAGDRAGQRSRHELFPLQGMQGTREQVGSVSCPPRLANC